MIAFELLHPRMTVEALGAIPSFLSPNDPRPAREQFHEAYAFAGGWSPFKGFARNPLNGALSYAGDPPNMPLAKAVLGDETIFLHRSAWVCIVQVDGSYEIARLD
jgi:hypothetical protein